MGEGGAAKRAVMGEGGASAGRHEVAERLGGGEGRRGSAPERRHERRGRAADSAATAEGGGSGEANAAADAKVAFQYGAADAKVAFQYGARSGPRDIIGPRAFTAQVAN